MDSTEKNILCLIQDVLAVRCNVEEDAIEFRLCTTLLSELDKLLLAQKFSLFGCSDEDIELIAHIVELL